MRRSTRSLLMLLGVPLFCSLCGGSSPNDVVRPEREGEEQGRRRQLLGEGTTRTKKRAAATTNNDDDDAMDGQMTSMFLAGILLSSTEVSHELSTSLVRLNCQEKVGLHVIVAASEERAEKRGKGEEEEEEEEEFDFQSHLEVVKGEVYGSSHVSCGPCVVMEEPAESADRYPTVAERLAFLRDFQRQHLRTILEARGISEMTLVGLLDFNLYNLPALEDVRRVTRRLQDDSEIGALCASGIQISPYGYHDSFSTVLIKGNTFPYPPHLRLVNSTLQLEDSSRILSEDAYGDVTRADLQHLFEQEADKSEAAASSAASSIKSKQLLSAAKAGLVRVKSCFGGLALYRAAHYFADSCKYLPNTNQLKSYVQYAARKDGRPSEHVIFNICLGRTANTAIYLDPFLITRTTAYNSPLSSLHSGGRISRGFLHREATATAALGEYYLDGLVRRSGASSAAEERLHLVNMDYQLRFDDRGYLVVDRTDGTGKPVWEAAPFDFYSHVQWTYMFLVLQNDGLLTVVQQRYVTTSLLDTDVGEMETTNDSNPPCDFVVKGGRACRAVVWTSGTRGKRSKTNGFYRLKLSRTGVVTVVQTDNNSVLWSSADHASSASSAAAQMSRWVGIKDANSVGTSCLASGDEEVINGALVQNASHAVLCQGAVFRLKAPLEFTMNHQQIYTEGSPTDSRRAVLQVVGDENTAAVSMKDKSFVQLRNVIIDGNRELLGPMDGPALVSAGGTGAVGQVIRQIKASHPRSWAILHVIEGSSERDCSDAVIVENELGPAGHAKIRANGIAIACKRSIVQNNVICDTTASAIKIFGSPLSVLADNIIVAKTRPALAGIDMTSFAPYGGNYTGTVVRGNVVDAVGAPIRVGVAVGQYLTACWNHKNDEKGDNIDNDNPRWLFGGVVTGNLLRGAQMGYGYAFNGVQMWTATQNANVANHSNAVSDTPADCHGGKLSPPGAFQLAQGGGSSSSSSGGGGGGGSPRSTGVFQSEFVLSNLDVIVQL